MIFLKYGPVPYAPSEGGRPLTDVNQLILDELKWWKELDIDNFLK
jgi:hypothetical protein